MSALASPVYELPADERRPGFGRLTRVELRKMLDTRSGLWSIAAVAAVTLITVIITALVKGGHDATLARLFNNSVEPAAILLPVLGVLLVCGEWSQRTTLTTFTLVPDRGRVLSAKVAAAILLAVAAFAVCLACSVIFGELLPAPGGPGSLSIVVLAQSLLFLTATMVIGVAFGAAIMLSAPAIVIYLVLPTAWDALSSTIPRSRPSATGWPSARHWGRWPRTRSAPPTGRTPAPRSPSGSWSRSSSGCGVSTAATSTNAQPRAGARV